MDPLNMGSLAHPELQREVSLCHLLEGGGEGVLTRSCARVSTWKGLHPALSRSVMGIPFARAFRGSA